MAAPVCNLTISFKVKLPWWWGFYVGAVRALHDAGVLTPNPDAMVGFIIRWTRFYTKAGNGRWKRYKR